MKIAKKIALFSSVGVFAICILAGQAIHLNRSNLNSQTINPSSLPVMTIHGSFVYDPSNIYESVGIVDYVFVGTVVSNNGTIYKDITPIENEDGTVGEVGNPYTNYTIQVSSNIKGNLQTDEPINILKQGGISQDGTEVYLFEDDSLPEAGQTYIFLAYAQPDGSLLISGPNSNIPVTDGVLLNNTDAKTNSTIAAYLDAYEHEIIPIDRERFESIYENQ